ncbi:PQQ-dependent dehydrogenase, methanol/ethanol family [Polymorphobacter sp. PAMC 29334]|uniref:PQQ-dependent dehydrogenase, methanol/ethanol family n=1 Tax=Polymorphobacter sp. PAMC 29334 TaxID=2862331 RepID=UPI001C770D8A|nr:PQQ-dependent dehydrogenase, methanol/ethanol family [Polymorphobacter sp. PAMC 29334]QYE36569.1 PQQ-dependent dehydrogenase, methanol/ethanol family [Polymorphobacter sp. PAMC 29334]
MQATDSGLRGRVIGKAAIGLVALSLAVVPDSGRAQGRADTPTNPYAGNRAMAAAGATLFAQTCAACHGEGGARSARAPALNGSLAHGDEAYDIFRTIHDGVRGAAMPSFSALPANEIWKLVTYIQSLGSKPVASAAVAARPAGDAAAGARLFFAAGGCGGCHEINGRGAVVASDLSDIGRKPIAAIRSEVLHEPPSRPPRDPFSVADVTLMDGSTVNGVIKRRDTFTLQLQQSDGAFILLDNARVRAVKVTATGGPRDTGERLGASGVDALVAYLAQQKRRDFTQTIMAKLPAGLPARRIAAADEPHNWLTYWGDYRGQHFSPLTQVSTANVATLQLRWTASLPGESPLQTTPLVVDGIVYTSGPPGDVYALDARTGQQLWKFSRAQDVRNPYQINPSNRGVAVLGSRVFFNTLDDNLIALDARSGRELWEHRLADTMRGYTMTGAPLALGDRIVVGMAGGEEGVSGFLSAFEPATGAQLWRFDTIPGPGVPGHETWTGDSWKTGGGATWLTGSYDADLDLVYWTVGNPGPDFNPVVRRGDNLYTDSVIALDAKTGRLKWHYQFTPNDSHDWDAVAGLVLADRVVDGRPRKLLLHADRNGFFYTLDRTDGAFVSGKNFVRQTWNAGFDANGRPQVRADSVATRSGQRVFPAVGGTNFQAPSYDAASGLLYLAFQDAEGFASYGDEKYEPGKQYRAGGKVASPEPRVEPVQGIMALDTVTGEKRWTFPLTRTSLSAGVLGTRGGLVFAATAEDWFIALDAATGKPLWKVQTGGPISASPISYAVGGEQFVAIAAGNTLMSFALPASTAAR